jgi:signal transduction histidine kinase
MLGSLLDNARQHGGPGVKVAVRAAVVNGGDVASVVVQDDGPGVSPANAARIFDPFFTTARTQGGTGLGLAVVRSLADACRGGVRLLPSPRGACFEIRLPAAPAAVTSRTSR